MYFIHIATMSDVEDFTSWLEGKNRLAFNDSEEFKTWLDGRNIFPLEIYIGGVTLRFCSKEHIEYFNIGFETAINIRLNNEN